MMRFRTLGMPREACCCLPTPYRIPKAVAGMAFNFSAVELSPKNHNAEPGTERRANLLFGFALQRLSPAS